MHLLERSSDEVIEHVGATAVLKYHIPHLVNYLSCSNGKERSGERGGGGGKRREGGKVWRKKKTWGGRLQLRDATRGEGGRRILEEDEQDHAFTTWCALPFVLKTKAAFVLNTCQHTTYMHTRTTCPETCIWTTHKHIHMHTT